MRYRTRSKEGAEWQALYNSHRWRKLRLAYLKANPLCRMCSQAGRVTPATICDHIKPHKGDIALFYGGPFQPLCKECHDGPKQSQERTGKAKPVIGLDGWPVEPSP